MRLLPPMLVLITVFANAPALAQMNKFVAPSWADTIQNPLKGNSSAAVQGKITYLKYCAPCHGDKGKGDGVAAAGLSKSPADHTSAVIQKQTDGAFYWMIMAGNNPMPNYKGVLTNNQVWELVDYIRTLSKTNKK